MNKKLVLTLSVFVQLISACSPVVSALTTPPLATKTVTLVGAQPPTVAATPTAPAASPGSKQYTNNQFGLSFQYPSS